MDASVKKAIVVVYNRCSENQQTTAVLWLHAFFKKKNALHLAGHYYHRRAKLDSHGPFLSLSLSSMRYGNAKEPIGLLLLGWQAAWEYDSINIRGDCIKHKQHTRRTNLRGLRFLPTKNLLPIFFSCKLLVVSPLFP